MTFITLNALRKRYGFVAALDGVDLAIERGSRTAIVGPSGSGKTTLLRLIAGFDVPDGGSIVIDGALLANGTHALPAYLRGIGVVMQDGALFPHLTIADNIGFGLAAAADRNARIAGLMDLVELERSMLARKPDQLSGGQQQRVALARALAIKPRLMLLDEPFSALDTDLRASTRNAVAKVLGDAGITTILVTHDQGEALSFADQVVVMRHGKIEQVGTPEDLYLRPSTARTAEFLGEAIVLPATVCRGSAECALGKIAVGNAGIDGAGWIMLRPEQIELLPNAVAQGGVSATVERCEFFGAWSSITIRLLDPPAHQNASLTFRRVGLPLIVGSRIDVALLGVAHRLPAAD